MRISFFAGVSATFLTCDLLQTASALRIRHEDYYGEIIHQDDNLA